MPHSEMTFCTVVTRNQLSRCQTLYESLKAHQGHIVFYALVSDALRKEDSWIRSKLPFEVIYPSDINIRGFNQMKIYYDAFELCNALRPSLIKFLILSRNRKKVIYLDADMYATSDFREIEKALEKYSFCLTPHITKPYPLDGMLPDDFTLFTYGIYNSGFMAFRRDKISLEILDFLIRRLRLYCWNDPPWIFVDQKWLELIASLYKPYLKQVGHPGYNIGYWNIHERKLHWGPNGLFVNGKRAVCFHFSGFDPGHPEYLTLRGSRPGQPKPKMVTRRGRRFHNRSNKALARLIKEYAERLKQYSAHWPKAYRYSENKGVSLTKRQRLLYYASRQRLNRLLRE